jgi:hypothetical protein
MQKQKTPAGLHADRGFKVVLADPRYGATASSTRTTTTTVMDSSRSVARSTGDICGGDYRERCGGDKREAPSFLNVRGRTTRSRRLTLCGALSLQTVAIASEELPIVELVQVGVLVR